MTTNRSVSEIQKTELSSHLKNHRENEAVEFVRCYESSAREFSSPYKNVALLETCNIFVED